MEGVGRQKRCELKRKEVEEDRRRRRSRMKREGKRVEEKQGRGGEGVTETMGSWKRRSMRGKNGEEETMRS